MKRHRWSIGLIVLGLLIGIGGSWWDFSRPKEAPTCDGQVMQRGDLCVSSRGSSRDYDGQLREQNEVQPYGWGVTGGILFIAGALSLISDFRKRDIVTVSDASLLTPEQVCAATGLSNPAKVDHWSGLSDDSASVDRPDWVGAVDPMQNSAYHRKGLKGVMRQSLRFENNDGTVKWGVLHGAIGYGSKAAAVKTFEAQRRLWATVSGQQVVDGKYRTNFGALSDLGDVLAMDRVMESGDGWTWQRMLAQHGNVIVEVRITGYRPDRAGTADLLDAAVAKATGVEQRPTRDRWGPARSGGIASSDS